MPTKPAADVGLYLPPEVLRLTHYSPNTRMIYAEVLQLAASGRVCQPSNPHFAARFGLSADTVGRALRELERDGLLVIDQDPQTGHNRTLTLPQIAAPTPPQTAEGTPPQNAAPLRKKSEGLPQNAEGASAKSRTEVRSRSKKEKEHLPTRVAAARPVGEESSKMESGPSAAALPRRPTALAEPPGFAAFYDGWPNKQKRRDAAKAFAALSADDQQLAAERATKWLREHPRQVERGACPFPATWLRGAMWTDGPEPPDRSPKPGQPVTPTTARTAADETLKRQREGNWK